MSDRLLERIVAEIRARGPLTWAEYMRRALYDPEDGFFTAAQPVGPGGHFVTSAHVSDLFARLIAGQVERACSGLQAPLLVDAGAGDGVLGASLQAALAGAGIEVVGVEQNAHGRAAIAAKGLRAVGSIEELAPVTGMVLANELFDNVPFHRVRGEAGAVTEVMVDVDADGRLIERDAALSEAAAPLVRELAFDGERAISPEAIALFRSMIDACAAGYVAVIDYGRAGEDPGGAVRGYRGHQLIDDLLSSPGSVDITGPVDFDALAVAARDAGWSVWGPVSQRRALMAAGYRQASAALRTRQQEDEAAGRWREAIATFGARGDASALVDPAGLGGFHVLVVGSPGLPELPMTAGNHPG